MLDVGVLVGKTLVKVEQFGNEEIVFTCESGEQYKLFHQQDCCESVYIEDVCGDLNDLVRVPLVLAEEATNRNDEAKDNYDESYTWTYYKFATVNGYVTIRWYGSSNGYYSESVDFVQLS